MTIIEFNEASYRLLIEPCGVPFRQTFSNKRVTGFGLIVCGPPKWSATGIVVIL